MTTQEHISNWLKDYAVKHSMSGYVVGLSGGIDSAVTSTLCAMTGLKIVVAILPIHQNPDHTARGQNHLRWLSEKFDVDFKWLDLTAPYESLRLTLPENTSPLALANTRARLRMTTLYAVAATENLLVAGTGNKVEDYGVGFFTKYGDGGVDVSPIGELTKTEVWQLGRDLGINEEIINAEPTDGLHPDSRSDVEQLGATYPELEFAMRWFDEGSRLFGHKLSDREKEVVDIYSALHERNSHKMSMPPVCPRL